MAACPKQSDDPTSAKTDKDDSSESLPVSVDTDSEKKPAKETNKKSHIKDNKIDKPKNESAIDCPVCLGPAVFPIRIPCGHIFCFLCVKGAVKQAKKCPMCRQPVPADFEKNPTILEREETETLDDGFQWYYEGKNGWWQYEKRTSEEIEENHKLNNKKFDLLICGTIYTIDLERNVQYNRENPSRRRKMKRENANNIAVKGVAGVH